MVRARRFRLLAAFLLAAAAAQAPFAQQPQITPFDFAPTTLDAPREACGTDFVYLQSLGLAFPTVLESGEPLMADQNPRIITADHTRDPAITILFVGDHSTVQFERGPDDVMETWEREGAPSALPALRAAQ